MFFTLFRWTKWRPGSSTWRDRKSSRRSKTKCNLRLRSSFASTSRTKRTSQWQFWSWRRLETKEPWKSKKEPEAPELNGNKAANALRMRFWQRDKKMPRRLSSSLLSSKRNRLCKMLRNSNKTRKELNLPDSRRELSKIAKRPRSKHTLKAWRSNMQMIWVPMRTELRITGVWCKI